MRNINQELSSAKGEQKSRAIKSGQENMSAFFMCIFITEFSE